MRIDRLSLTLAAALAVSACATLPPSGSPDAPGPSASGPGTSAGTPPAADQPKRAKKEAAVKRTEPLPPPEPTDLWTRIRAGFQLPERDHARVEAERRHFARHPGYMDREVDRAEPYLHYIVEEIDRRGLPMELALLPIVESAFQPFAYSPGQAAGIWQFIPATGEHYGLKQTWWYDGRRDVIASTRAALDYLERLHNRFGDWELALAAYNSGQGTVGRAVRKAQARGRDTDFWSLDLPSETEGYVPRLLAIRDLVAEPQRFGLALRSLPDEPYLEIVNIGSQIDLALAAELAELPIEEIYRLNPGYNRWATDPDGPHRLVLPIPTAERFREKLSALPDEQRVRWHRHQVSAGQTLIHIARDYRTNVDVIKQANELTGNMIRAGQYLLVPIASAEAEVYALSAGQRLAALKDRDRAGHKRLYKVRPGDTLWDISRSFGVDVGELSRWNGMSPRDLLRPGAELVIWVKDSAAADTLASAPIPKLQRISYTVRRGDSLYVIAQRFKVTVDQLRQWNDLPRRGYLQPGQRLTVHVDVTKQSGGRI